MSRDGAMLLLLLLLVERQRATTPRFRARAGLRVCRQSMGGLRGDDAITALLCIFCVFRFRGGAPLRRGNKDVREGGGRGGSEVVGVVTAVTARCVASYRSRTLRGNYRGRRRRRRAYRIEMRRKRTELVGYGERSSECRYFLRHGIPTRRSKDVAMACHADAQAVAQEVCMDCRHRRDRGKIPIYSSM
ncbi:hypothetical protein M440DRAFT_1247095 [Trichoderma longibrachiatum ATCC 18648]|uniref:Secreted protein n=1 Tax=Trichoderma longibrachiatum ATCC 18648 TaxID=983965 RepID=A0A2T4C3L6_TRILO|nr:hypothetical protein M440DRAFT_1247095 [Trichoderma longibrachiatum ATCC 18648]